VELLQLLRADRRLVRDTFYVQVGLRHRTLAVKFGVGLVVHTGPVPRHGPPSMFKRAFGVLLLDFEVVYSGLRVAGRLRALVVYREGGALVLRELLVLDVSCTDDPLLSQVLLLRDLILLVGVAEVLVESRHLGAAGREGTTGVHQVLLKAFRVDW